MSLSFIFSPDSREVFTWFLKTVARPYYNAYKFTMHCFRDTRTKLVPVSRKQCIVNSPDTSTNIERPSHDSLAKYFGKKICIKFLNMFKTSRPVHDKFVTRENSHDTRTNVMRKSAKKFANQSREIRMPVRY